MKFFSRYPKTASIFIIFMICQLGCKADIYEAARKNDIDRLRELLAENVDVNQTRSDSISGMYGGVTPLMEAARSGSFDVVKMLAANGADLLARDDLEQDVAWYAVGHPDILDFVLTEGGGLVGTTGNAANSVMRLCLARKHFESCSIVVQNGLLDCVDIDAIKYAVYNSEDELVVLMLIEIRTMCSANDLEKLLTNISNMIGNERPDFLHRIRQIMEE